jgi:hypothetical protein
MINKSCILYKYAKQAHGDEECLDSSVNNKRDS